MPLELHIPHKKPRKSKANPQPALTAEQKAYNQDLSRVRIGVENAICRLKRFRTLIDVFRNRVATFIDDVALAAAGLANWSLTLAQAAARRLFSNKSIANPKITGTISREFACFIFPLF